MIDDDYYILVVGKHDYVTIFIIYVKTSLMFHITTFVIIHLFRKLYK